LERISEQMPDKFLSGISGYELFTKFMRSKILSKRTLLSITVLSGLTLLMTLSSYFITKSSIQEGSVLLIENTAVLEKQAQARSELPVRLKIPSINVDAPVEYVGLTPDGAMDVPKGPTKVAWFNLGSRPGEIGSSVIAGHYDWKNKRPAVFDHLYKIRKGDKIYIENEKGAIITFVVRDIRIYGKDDDVLDVFSSSDGKAHLNLITCTGVWNKTEKTRSHRLIVFTDKE